MGATPVIGFANANPIMALMAISLNPHDLKIKPQDMSAVLVVAAILRCWELS